MKKKNYIKKFILFSVIVLFSTPQLTYSQVKTYTTKKFKPPIVTVEVLFSYAQPLPNLYSDMAHFFQFTGYGVKYGLGSQINVKLSADKKGTLKPYLSLGYSLFMGKDNGTAYIDSNIIKNGYTLPGSLQFNSTGGTSKMFINDFLVGAGFEYDFVNKTKWTPYLGADLDMNVLFGTYRQDPNQTVGNNTVGEVSYTIKQAVRFGFGVGGGINFRISPAFGFAFSTKYKFANLLGKSSSTVYEENKMGLLDKSSLDLNSMLSKSRNIDYLEFMIGAAFYIGRK